MEGQININFIKMNYQNELSKHIASFLLRPYLMKKMENVKKDDIDN
jgi:hypothetical protein